MNKQLPPDFSNFGPTMFWKDCGYLLSRFVLIVLALAALSWVMNYSLDQTNRKDFGGKHLHNSANTRCAP
jgi:hypothetical protein